MAITDEPMDRIVFEVISGFATCGLSVGLSEASPRPLCFRTTTTANSQPDRKGHVACRQYNPARSLVSWYGGV